MFKLAKVMAPSIIYIDDVDKVSTAPLAVLRRRPPSQTHSLLCLEACAWSAAQQHEAVCVQVFVADKKRAKLLGGVEPYNRIKKDLLKLASPPNLC